MAQPTAPTITSICTEAFNRCGVPSPTVAQLSRAEQEWFEPVKRSIADRKDWHNVEETLIVIPQPFTQVVAMPTPLQRVLRMRFYRGEKTGTAQSGGTSSITIAAGTGDANDRGKKIFLTGGTGEAQSGRIISITNDTYTMSCPWATVPDDTTTYVVAETEEFPNGPNMAPLHGISPSTTITQWDFIEHTLRFWPPVDDANQYAIEIDGLVDLSLVDNSDARITRLLREWREALVRGLMVYIKEDQDDPDIDRDERKFDKATLAIMRQDTRKRLRGDAPAFRSLGGGIRRRR